MESMGRAHEPAMRHVSVYLTNEEWIVAGMSRTTAGVWIANLTLERLARHCPEEDLGERIVGVMETSEVGVAHPASWPEFHRQFMARLNVQSLLVFEKNSQLLKITQTGELYILTPHQYRLAKSAYEPLAGKIELLKADARALGEAVRQCLPTGPATT
jgi:hypothetical protein